MPSGPNKKVFLKPEGVVFLSPKSDLQTDSSEFFSARIIIVIISYDHRLRPQVVNAKGRKSFV